MRINSINAQKNYVDVSLSIDELIDLCNALYSYTKRVKNDDLKEKHHDDTINSRLYDTISDLIMARDLCQYGHLDSHSMKTIIQNRYKSGSMTDKDMQQIDV